MRIPSSRSGSFSRIPDLAKLCLVPRLSRIPDLAKLCLVPRLSRIPDLAKLCLVPIGIPIWLGRLQTWAIRAGCAKKESWQMPYLARLNIEIVVLPIMHHWVFLQHKRLDKLHL